MKLLHSLLGMLEFKPGTRGAYTPPEKMFAPLEKCDGDSLKQLDILLKNLGLSQKTFRRSFGSNLVTGLLEFTARVF